MSHPVFAGIAGLFVNFLQILARHPVLLEPASLKEWYDFPASTSQLPGLAALAGIPPCDGEPGLTATTGEDPMSCIRRWRQVSLVAVFLRRLKALRQFHST
jgi:hypothetical protein